MNISLIVKILSDTANATKKEQFEAWLQESDRNKDYYAKIRILWESMEGVYNKVEFNEAAAKLKIRSDIQERHATTSEFKVRFLIIAAASILLLFGLGYISFNNFIPGNSNLLVYSSADTIHEIILSDGSRIWLNANSSLKAPKNFSKNQRKVFLKGEAYFEITRDESRKFKVRAANTVTEVLGTSFTIKTDTAVEDVSIIVNSGRVSFSRANSLWEKTILAHGDKAHYFNYNSTITKSINQDQNYLSWKTGVLIFYDTPLDKVCLDLSKLYKKKVQTKNSASEILLTGSFRNEKLEDILRTIEITLNVEISESQNEIFIYN